MNILEKIVEAKRTEVQQNKLQHSLEDLQQTVSYSRDCLSLTTQLRAGNSSGIIAEFKRRSPSKGLINGSADPVDVTRGYEQAGAAAVSVLTDSGFFGGSNQDLIRVKEVLSIPVLRKEFIVDPYQVVESKSIGADLILLIAACLTPDEVKSLSALAKSIGLEVLLELHDEDELGHVCDTVDLVGINNRSLKTFDVNVERSLRMAAQLPANAVKVAESGIDNPEQVKIFRDNGYSAFLIGEHLMKTEDPRKALLDFITSISC
jgi:indole-3-glycerol phosphate synthase